MIRQSHQGLTCRPFAVGWWLRLFAVLLFTYSANYGRVHLALEAHLEEWTSSASNSPGEREAATLGADQHHDHGGHLAHLASDHSVRLAPQEHIRHVPLQFVAATAAVELGSTVSRLPLFLTERQNPPGLPPPDPLQPRAPPLA